MFRKNSQERTHSAGARVASSRKLPSDFFTPSKKHNKPNQSIDSSESCQPTSLPMAKRVSDSMLFTFSRNNSFKNFQHASTGNPLKKTGTIKIAKFSEKIQKSPFGEERRQSRLMKASRNIQNNKTNSGLKVS